MVIERGRRGAGQDPDRERDEEIEHRTLEILERDGCDWVDAWSRAKAELEFEIFTAGRRALPSPVEKHFDNAVKNAKLLERGRREMPKGKGGKKH